LTRLLTLTRRVLLICLKSGSRLQLSHAKMTVRLMPLASPSRFLMASTISLTSGAATAMQPLMLLRLGPSLCPDEVGLALVENLDADTVITFFPAWSATEQRRSNPRPRLAALRSSFAPALYFSEHA
jgi:hypothetical protein